MIVTDMNKAMFHTLHTLIAPGNRVRLSPYVESAQFKMLFGEKPDPAARHEDSLRILQLRKAKSKVKDLAKIWSEFAQGGKEFHSGAYSQEFLEAYLAYYFTTNVCKIQLVLLELAKRGLLRDRLSILDIGVGAGATAVATLDFLAAWAIVCDLYDQAFPITSINLLGLDSNPMTLEFSRSVCLAFADVLEEQRASVTEERVKNLLLNAARAGQWQMCNLEKQQPQVCQEPRILVAANVLNELSEQGKLNLASAIAALHPGSLAVVIEPGEKRKTQQMNCWRKDLVRRYDDIFPILPCGEELGQAQSEACGECWNARREHLHVTSLYHQFRSEVSSLVGDRRSWDNFENNLLSWSYTVLQHGSAFSKQKRDLWKVEDNAVQGSLRYISTVRKYKESKKQPEVMPSDLACSSLQDSEEYINFCPASGPKNDLKLLTLIRPSGFLVGRVSHGELVQVNGLKLVENRFWWELRVSQEQRRENLFHRQQLVQDNGSGVTGFLGDYNERTCSAIDHLAYRLFGFLGMRPFQHEILKRTLTGRSVLGIAATGGGKSECYILPAMLLPGMTVVVSPLKSLMQDQYDQRINERYGLQHLATFVNGDVTFREREARLKRMELGFYKLAYFTPEQLDRGYVLDSLKRTHDAVGIRFLALDEAHCISQWGHDFRPSYLNLWHRIKERGITPVRIALTATASPEVRRDILDELQIAEGDLYVHSSNRPELNLTVCLAATSKERSEQIEREVSRLLQDNRTKPRPGAAIVFMPHTGGDPELTARTVQQSGYGRLSAGVNGLAAYLEKRLGCKVAIYHGKMEDNSQNENTSSGPDDAYGEEQQLAYENRVSAKKLGDLSARTRRGEQNAFIRGARDVMVATKGFGMGIDKPNIRLIVHRCAPSNLEAYAQEAGRAGRDGNLANVVLFHSAAPATDEGVFGEVTVPADYEIQQLFLSEKYVRRIDILAIRAFLMSRRGQGASVGTVFFTNDEAIAFFERFGKKETATHLQAYAWPTFPARIKRGGYQSPEHTSILDRGHEYQEKTKYIGRILAAMYRIRPIKPNGSRVEFVKTVNEVQPVIVGLKVLDASAIVNSNHNFGDLFRSLKVNFSELRELLEAASGEAGVLDLANRLRISLADAAQLVSDIKEADGRIVSGRWRPRLLDFLYRTVPRRVSTAVKASTAAWREYAGASKRAWPDKAKERANQARRDKPNLDDWFGETELPKPKGWEVAMGSALLIEDEFNEALDRFVAEHDSRKQNDWASYRLLLTDYIGVSERGEPLPRQAKNCLRAVMLGYLETFEVVAGDDCRSCSRCRPRGDFETDLAWRREQMVVRLSPGISGHLRDLKASERTIPSQEATQRFWAEVEDEERCGRSSKAYVLGWTAKLLTDSPGHQAALWLRLSGMARGTLTFQAEEFFDYADRLASISADGAALQVLELLRGPLPSTQNNPRLLRVIAKLEYSVGQKEQSAQTWLLLLEGVDASQAVGLLSSRHIHEAHAALSLLFAPGEPLVDPIRQASHTLAAARTASEPSQALTHYLALIPSWTSHALEAEIEWLKSKRLPNLAPWLVRAWLTLDTATRAEEVIHLISLERRWESWEEEGTVALLNDLPQDLLTAAPDLQFWLVEAWLRGVAHVDRARVAVAALIALRIGWVPGPATLRQVCQLVFEEMVEGDALAAVSSSRLDMALLHDKAEKIYRPESASAMLRWLAWFPRDRVAATPDKALSNLRLGCDLVSNENQFADKTIQFRLLEVLRTLRNSASVSISLTEQVYQLWMPICQRHPPEAGLYLGYLAKSGAPAALIDEILDLVLHNPNADFRVVAEDLTLRPACGSPRLQSVIRLAELLERLVNASDIADSMTIETRHLSAIRQVFRPERDEMTADMAVELLDFLRKKLNPRWLTPITDLIQTLVLAKRFEEAREVSEKALSGPAGGRLDIRKIPVSTYLAEHCKGQSRTPPPERLDYQRVINSFTRNWTSFRRRPYS